MVLVSLLNYTQWVVNGFILLKLGTWVFLIKKGGDMTKVIVRTFVAVLSYRWAVYGSGCFVVA